MRTTSPTRRQVPLVSRQSRVALVGGIGFLAFCLIHPASNQTPTPIEGIVSLPDGSAGGGARVRLRATDSCALTDANGQFKLHGFASRVTASKVGYLIAGAPRAARVRLRLTALPASDDSAYEWIDPKPGGSQNCGTCHAEIYREWVTSAHAHSATGTYFRDLYEGTDASGRPGVSWGLKPDLPDAAGVCSACHAPAIGDNDPARLDLGRVRGVAALGVHCDFCHKVCGTGQTPPGLTHGTFDLRLLRPSAGQLFFGPLDDVDRGEDAYSPLYHDSRYCASCHEGTVLGVHVYSTYSEWLASPARREGKQCQDCHMAPTGTMTNIAPAHGGVERNPKSLASHRLFLGSQAEMLRKAVRVEISFSRQAGKVGATVRVTADGAGHRVPTGFIDRHLLLVVDGSDAAGRPLAPTARPTLEKAAGLDLAGRAGKLYGRLRSGFDGLAPVPFWRGGPDPVDTRLVPGKLDESRYTFAGTLARLRVRLLYRRFWREVQTAKGWADTEMIVVDEEENAPP
jgi:Cytochrome c554 and c-prime